MKNSFTTPNKLGFYGDFGGAFIPELLQRNVEELNVAFLNFYEDSQFLNERNQLLQYI